MLGQTVTVTVDRAKGSVHPEYPNTPYPVNYGYIEGIIAPDGQEQDAYILGVDIPIWTFTGKVIAIVHRKDDIEEKWVVAPAEMRFTKQEIEEKIAFIEQYFHSSIEVLEDMVDDEAHSEQRWTYTYVNVEYDGEPFLLSDMSKHREIINQYARRGYRYVGVIPTSYKDVGYFRRMDLVFEKELRLFTGKV